MKDYPSVILRYIPLLQEINLHIDTFNSFLKEEFKVPLIDLDLLGDDQYFHIMNGKTWDKISFPRKCDKGGVYFFFGHSEKNEEELITYVGKASLQNTTGKRLYNHFNKAFDENGRIFKTDNNEKFFIEAVVIIPFEEPRTLCFAPALEEHIIKGLTEGRKYRLHNTRGFC